MSQYIFINLLAETLISWSDFLLSISLVNDCTRLGSSIIEQILSASSLDLLTSNNIPLFLFIYSGIPPIFDPITGVPHAIASKPTRPSGSSLDGKINIEAMLLECHLLGKEERGCLCFNFKIEPKEKSFYLKYKVLLKRLKPLEKQR